LAADAAYPFDDDAWLPADLDAEFASDRNLLFHFFLLVLKFSCFVVWIFARMG